MSSHLSFEPMNWELWPKERFGVKLVVPFLMKKTLKHMGQMTSDGGVWHGIDFFFMWPTKVL